MTGQQASMLKVAGLTAFYGRIQALRGVDVEVNTGEIVTLIGANGAGKSTLMMTICGRPRARDGEILFEETDITRMPTHEIMRLGIAQAPEGRRIFPRMTVKENLQMGAELAHGDHFGEDVAKAVQLGIEYAPHPPYDAGSPEGAGEAVEKAAREAAKERQAQREAAVQQAASRLQS